MNNVSNIKSFQERLEQSRAAKAGLKPADQVHWQAVIERVDEPEIARLIVRFCDHTAPEIKTRQPGLYLRAKMVLANDFQARESAAKDARRLRLDKALRGLGGVVFFAYRCFRLPLRAMRDLAAMMFRRRSQNRPLFHH